ncbi:exonuclease domain-containing protein [Zhongshania sp.]|uniref:3'-5' exonuclease n=1 Tax=Zhongshania sp. TaxID=1971902 RepID=UPI003563CEA4
MIVLPFDTETNGLPLWKEPSESEGQPHIVQLAAILADAESQEIKAQMDVIVRPDGWEIPPELTEIHGISQEQAMDEGIPEEEALDQFMALHEQCDMRVAHNTTFDNRIVRIALKRFRPDLVSDDEWKDRNMYFCTLVNARKIMGGRNGHTLAEAYEYFTGKTLENAHNALADATACMEIYFAMIGDCEKEKAHGAGY